MPAAKKKVEVGNDALLERAGAVLEPAQTDGVGLRTPDLTPAQLVGAIPILANLLHVFGVFSLSQAEQDALTDTFNYALALIGADAVIRVGRSLGSTSR